MRVRRAVKMIVSIRRRNLRGTVMKTGAGGDFLGIRNARKKLLIAGVCSVALAMAGALSVPAAAETYFVSTAGELRDSITAANADGDPSSTIVMTANFGVDGVGLPGATKTLMIDTNGFTLSTAGNNSIILQSGAGPITLEGTITGVGIAANSTNAAISIRGISSIVNNATIQGGASSAGLGATGVDLGGPPAGPATLVNNGIIRGGDGTTTGGLGLLVRTGANPVINTGTIEGGNGANAIRANSAATNLSIINSGTIRAGVGQPDAIVLAAGSTGAINLELQSGSEIFGNVIGGTGLNDRLALGGDEDDSFDVSAIGAAVQYRNFNIFEKTDASTWTITGIGSGQAAPWDIYEGTLLMAAGSDLGDGPIDLLGGTLAGIGTVGATTAAAGTVISPGINGIGTLTIDGDYAGDGNLLEIETVLGGDGSATDLLVVNGATSGTTSVQVTNLGGTGAQTVEGIKIVDITGTSNGEFSLLGEIVLNGEQAVLEGAYAYSLFQGGITDPTDGDWYLRSAGFSPTVTSYESYAGVLLGLIEMPTFQQRRGNIYMPSRTDGFMVADPTADVSGYAPPPGNVWARIEAPFGHYEGNSDSGTEYDLSRFRVQIGIDGQLSQSDTGMVIAGVNAQYGHANADLSSDTGDGDNSTDSFGGGLSLTWLGKSGSYVDAQASAHYLQSDLSSDVVGELVSNNEGLGYGLSLETGHKLNLDAAWSITPQAQLAYTSVDFDDFTDPLGTDVSLETGESLKGRIGLALGHDIFDGESRTHVYAVANLTYEFLGEQSVDVAGVNVAFKPQKFGGELGLGGTYEWAGGKYAIEAEALGQSSFEGSYGIKGTVGFSTRF